MIWHRQLDVLIVGDLVLIAILLVHRCPQRGALRFKIGHCLQGLWMLLAVNRQLLLQSGFSSDHLAQPALSDLVAKVLDDDGVDDRAASSAEDAVKETEMRYERVSFVTTIAA